MGKGPSLTSRPAGDPGPGGCLCGRDPRGPPSPPVSPLTPGSVSSPVGRSWDAPRCMSSRADRGPMATRHGRAGRLAIPASGRVRASWRQTLTSAPGGTLEAVPRDDRKEAAPRTSCPAGRLQLPAAPAAPRLRPGRQDATMAAAAVAAPEVLRECGCKGIRTCLICERQRGGDPPWQHPPQVRAGGGAVPQLPS